MGNTTIDEALANIKSMGFNTVRLPYSNECLECDHHQGQCRTTRANRAYNLEGKRPLDVMDAVIARAKANGLQIILDPPPPDLRRPVAALVHVGRPGDEVDLRLRKCWPTGTKNDPTVIGADLHNEPYGAATWGRGYGRH